ncbi:DUF3164 family protein [Shewanella algae]|uniref:DUF3164 family protein n=1 Tax=Shewanella algae TaxID=38313 RepID=UPI001AACAA58|nr:DUF3164 family protein [Shewanella algae]MBO2656187.1 DUF3164 family protein [Shewanella algae]
MHDFALHGITLAPPPAIPEGYMADSKGRLIPLQAVDDWQLEQDAMVKNLHQMAQTLQSQLREFKIHVYSECYAFLDLLAEKYNRKQGGGQRQRHLQQL